MKATVYCRTTAKGVQSFYIRAEGKTYFLFQQDYRVSNRDYFRKGVRLDDLGRYAGAHSASVRKTLDKLPAYIRYIEKEYGIAVYERTKRAAEGKGGRPERTRRERRADGTEPV